MAERALRTTVGPPPPCMARRCSSMARAARPWRRWWGARSPRRSAGGSRPAAAWAGRRPGLPSTVDSGVPWRGQLEQLLVLLAREAHAGVAVDQAGRRAVPATRRPRPRGRLRRTRISAGPRACGRRQRWLWRRRWPTCRAGWTSAVSAACRWRAFDDGVDVVGAVAARELRAGQVGGRQVHHAVEAVGHR